MRFGYFDDELREYVINQPDTPLPWINYLGCENYFGIISNTAGGYSFYRDARLRRLTRYRYNNVPFDAGGRYLYLRDDDNGSFWSPTWAPVKASLDEYSCRHGMGYTTIHSVQNQIEATARYFVPLGENLEIWELTLTNQRETAATVSVYSCVEFALWDAYDDMTNFQRNFNTGEVEVEGNVIYHKTEYRERRDHFAYFACSDDMIGFDTQREDFLGAYRGWDNPKVVEQGYSEDSIAHGWSPIGSHHVAVSLAAGESRKVIFVLGYQENPKDEKFQDAAHEVVNKKSVYPVLERYLDAVEVEQAFTALRNYWDDLLQIFQVATPDEHTNRMVNVWTAYQTMVTFNLSRSASFYESGVGRGMGFRDSNQDLLGVVQLIPERARERILDLAATQFEDGGAFHQYQPLTKRGNDNVGSNFNDDPLWMVLSVNAYVKETGDYGILDEMVPFQNQPGTEETLFEHLRRSLQYTLDRIGKHGLPLIGRADWNDCLNLNTFSEEPGESFQTTTNKDGKNAESVFIAGLFVAAAKEMAGLLDYLGKSTDADFYREKAESMTQVTLKNGWDGNWFLRAYDDLGDKVGSQTCEEGQIFIEPQGYCVMAGIGLDNGYAQKALDSVAERLATKHGIVLNQPAYTRYYLNLGEISSYPPGYKENAGIFCHSNPWIVIAETLVGNGDRAFEYYSNNNPSKREAISEIHRCEPYVYAQMIAGKDAPTHGEAKNSWLTGTAAWNYVAITQWILGVRSTHQGLQVAPVLPSDWQSFEAVRKHRGVIYEIKVDRQGDGNQVSLEVDGKAIEGSVVPLPEAGVTKVQVRVNLK
ncbi:MAG: glycosyl transferase [Anaerolineales bacterium]|nr:glycosyl transferase [Anaerolineales bacterium]